MRGVSASLQRCPYGPWMTSVGRLAGAAFWGADSFGMSASLMPRIWRSPCSDFNVDEILPGPEVYTPEA